MIDYLGILERARARRRDESASAVLSVLVPAGVSAPAVETPLPIPDATAKREDTVAGLLRACPPPRPEIPPALLSGAGWAWPDDVADLRPGSHAACSLCGAGSWTHAAVTGLLVPLCRQCVKRPMAALVVRYRTALHRCWALVSLGADATPADCAAVLDVVQALEHDLGPQATRARHRWAREWFNAEGSCPICGGPEYHDPERPGGDA